MIQQIQLFVLWSLGHTPPACRLSVLFNNRPGWGDNDIKPTLTESGGWRFEIPHPEKEGKVITISIDGDDLEGVL